MLNRTKHPIARALGPDHFARCTVASLLARKPIDLRMAIYDLRAARAFACADLISEFNDDLVFDRTSLRSRLFRFKLAKRWDEHQTKSI